MRSKKFSKILPEIRLVFLCHKVLTLFQAGSGITFPGRFGQILPISSLGYMNPLNDLVVHEIYSQLDILDFTNP